jgi:uncharacterized protein YbbC (DUF1343 family)
VRDRATFRPFATYLALIRAARAQDERAFSWRREPYEFEERRLAIDLLLGRSDLRPAIEAGVEDRELEQRWSADLAAFQTLRQRYLLYP